jgi:hypothetical protein
MPTCHNLPHGDVPQCMPLCVLEDATVPTTREVVCRAIHQPNRHQLATITPDRGSPDIAKHKAATIHPTPHRRRCFRAYHESGFLTRQSSPDAGWP